MDDKKIKNAPDEGPNGVDRWTSNGYGLIIDGVEVKNPTDEEADHGTKTQKHGTHKR